MHGLHELHLQGPRVLLKPTEDEEVYREAMTRSHRILEPKIYHAALEFRFHPGKVLLDLCSQESGLRLGGFSLHDFRSSELRSCEMGYWILPEYQGKGLIHEGAELLLDHLFRVEKMQRITLICDERNLRSMRVAKRLGFDHEAYLNGVDLITHEPVTKLIFARFAE